MTHTAHLISIVDRLDAVEAEERSVLDDDGISALIDLSNARDDIRALAQAESTRAQATPDEIDAARKAYAHGSDDNIEVDDNALVSRGEDGVWVQAWVWVRNTEEA